jgi:hypothetical protein
MFVTDSQDLMDEWNTVAMWASRIFEGLNPEDCWIGWAQIERLLTEGRLVSMRVGTKEDNPKY